MRIIVVSDTHGNTGNLRDAVIQALEGGKIDILVHLGDGCEDLERVRPMLDKDTRVEAVLGNRDRSGGKAESVFMADGVRFYACHGNQWDVKFGMERLSYAAQEREANVALYGHTHINETIFAYGIWFINPGSLGASRWGGATYAEIITDKDGTVHPKLFKLK